MSSKRLVIRYTQNPEEAHEFSRNYDGRRYRVSLHHIQTSVDEGLIERSEDNYQHKQKYECNIRNHKNCTDRKNQSSCTDKYAKV